MRVRHRLAPSTYHDHVAKRREAAIGFRVSTEPAALSVIKNLAAIVNGGK